MTGFEILGYGDGLTDEEQMAKDEQEHPEVVQAVRNAFADYDAKVAAAMDSTAPTGPVVIPASATAEPDEDTDYFNDLLDILNGKAPAVPKQQSALEPLQLPTKGARPLFDYNAEVGDDDVIFKPKQEGTTTEFDIPVTPETTPKQDDKGLTLSLTPPNPNN